jgi:dephospho-CoA kinase
MIGGQHNSSVPRGGIGRVGGAQIARRQHRDVVTFVKADIAVVRLAAADEVPTLHSEVKQRPIHHVLVVDAVRQVQAWRPGERRAAPDCKTACKTFQIPGIIPCVDGR